MAALNKQVDAGTSTINIQGLYIMENDEESKDQFQLQLNSKKVQNYQMVEISESRNQNQRTTAAYSLSQMQRRKDNMLNASELDFNQGVGGSSTFYRSPPPKH